MKFKFGQHGMFQGRSGRSKLLHAQLTLKHGKHQKHEICLTILTLKHGKHQKDRLCWKLLPSVAHECKT